MEIIAPISDCVTHPISFIAKWESVVNNKSKFYVVPAGSDLKEFNISVNSWFKYISENIDEWSTPVEFLQHGGGDCEDFAIFKFYSLALPKYLAIGTLLDGRAHAICVVYSAEHKEWVVLDCINNDLTMWKEYILSFTPLYLCDLDGVYV